MKISNGESAITQVRVADRPRLTTVKRSCWPHQSRLLAISERDSNNLRAVIELDASPQVIKSEKSRDHIVAAHTAFAPQLTTPGPSKALLHT